MDVDVDVVADELYGLAPERFTEARDERAARARKAGQSGAAKAIAALRRPTRAAYASNLLVRRRPEEVAAFLELGEALRRAQRSLDGSRLQALSHQRHAVVAALARTARQLAEEEGRAVSEGVAHEVEQTLRAALADPGAAEQWSGGRLSAGLSPPVGFTGLPEKAPVRPQSDRPAKQKQERKQKQKPKQQPEPEPEPEQRPKPKPKPSREAEQRRARAERARAEAAAREAELRAAEQELAEADARVGGLERRLREARTARTEARRALAGATDRARDAARAARE
ncbi:hypothetical protein CP980_01830 [Streptomyces vinaceus]|uniref:Uncharacterized protein n=1 Tax=Streptomyces vinaceus TaxID=1960 RepID=A0A5J6J8J9_STRVI|nr:hypothetical protein [Streptomyces vinaceus]QEV43976.1 hypothetical protein CP980_01830 [Streptomyces vinaceus]GHE74971.1 hypothetical protein GCM10017778_70780 [Streptomyces vinaceus]